MRALRAEISTVRLRRYYCRGMCIPATACRSARSVISRPTSPSARLAKARGYSGRAQLTVFWRKLYSGSPRAEQFGTLSGPLRRTARGAGQNGGAQRDVAEPAVVAVARRPAEPR